jgi:hypothetical protein
MLILSPYVDITNNPNHVDHTPRTQASILRFIERRFGIPTLGGADVTADDLHSAFNLSQQPIPYGSAISTSMTSSAHCVKGAELYE